MTVLNYLYFCPLVVVEVDFCVMHFSRTSPSVHWKIQHETEFSVAMRTGL